MPLSKDMGFSSERLTYRGIRRDDAAIIVAWRSDPANYRNFSDARSITMGEHLSWFEGYLKDLNRYDFMVLEGGDPIGTCSLVSITSDGCEVGYMIGDRTRRGQGYATEALCRVVELAFDELGVERVDACVLPGNDASLKVACKAGFVVASGGIDNEVIVLSVSKERIVRERGAK